ncbi:MAG: hypothetical protein ACP5M4_00800 [Acidobacteriaceae bacterium]
MQTELKYSLNQPARPSTLSPPAILSRKTNPAAACREHHPAILHHEWCNPRT